MRATEAVPILVGQQQWAAVWGAGGDQHHVMTLDVEVTLQVMINVPRNRREMAGPQHVGEMSNGQIVGLFIVQSSCSFHLALPPSQAPAGGADAREVPVANEYRYWLANDQAN